MNLKIFFDSIKHQFFNVFLNLRDDFNSEGYVVTRLLHLISIYFIFTIIHKAWIDYIILLNYLQNKSSNTVLIKRVSYAIGRLKKLSRIHLNQVATLWNARKPKDIEQGRIIAELNPDSLQIKTILTLDTEQLFQIANVVEYHREVNIGDTIISFSINCGIHPVTIQIYTGDNLLKYIYHLYGSSNSQNKEKEDYDIDCILNIATSDISKLDVEMNLTTNKFFAYSSDEKKIVVSHNDGSFYVSDIPTLPTSTYQPAKYIPDTGSSLQDITHKIYLVRLCSAAPGLENNTAKLLEQFNIIKIQISDISQEIFENCDTAPIEIVTEPIETVTMPVETVNKPTSMRDSRKNWVEQLEKSHYNMNDFHIQNIENSNSLDGTIKNRNNLLTFFNNTDASRYYNDRVSDIAYDIFPHDYKVSLIEKPSLTNIKYSDENNVSMKNILSYLSKFDTRDQLEEKTKNVNLLILARINRLSKLKVIQKRKSTIGNRNAISLLQSYILKSIKEIVSDEYWNKISYNKKSLKWHNPLDINDKTLILKEIQDTYNIYLSNSKSSKYCDNSFNERYLMKTNDQKLNHNDIFDIDDSHKVNTRISQIESNSNKYHDQISKKIKKSPKHSKKTFYNASISTKLGNDHEVKNFKLDKSSYNSYSSDTYNTTIPLINLSSIDLNQESSTDYSNYQENISLIETTSSTSISLDIMLVTSFFSEEKSFPWTQNHIPTDLFMGSIISQSTINSGYEPCLHIVKPIYGEPTENDNLCTICLSTPRNIVFVPCSHCCCCQDCLDYLVSTKCPICRSEVTSYLNLNSTDLSNSSMRVDSSDIST